MSAKSPERTFTLAEAAEYLRVSEKQAAEYIKDGVMDARKQTVKLAAFKLGRRWRVTDQAMADFLAALAVA